MRDFGTKCETNKTLTVGIHLEKTHSSLGKSIPRSSKAIWTFQRECSFFSFNILPINPIILQTFCLNVVLLKKKI